MKDVVRLYVYAYDNHVEYVTSNKTEFIDYLDDEIIIDKDNLQNGYNSTMSEISNCILGVDKGSHQLKYIKTMINV